MQHAPNGKRLAFLQFLFACCSATLSGMNGMKSLHIVHPGVPLTRWPKSGTAQTCKKRILV